MLPRGMGCGGSGGKRSAFLSPEPTPSLNGRLLPLLQVPEEIQDKEFSVILQDDPLQPLALVPLTEEEQVGREWANGLLLTVPVEYHGIQASRNKV